MDISWTLPIQQLYIYIIHLSIALLRRTIKLEFLATVKEINEEEEGQKDQVNYLTL